MAKFDPVAAYDSGFVGAYSDPRADEMFADSIIRSGGRTNGSDIAHEWGFADLGKGKLTPMWQRVMDVWPGCWPGPPQDVGDCVSWGLTRAALMSWTCELLDGRPDEVTGLVEGKPDVSPEGIANCVISSEAAFWWRGHNGDGWSCSAAANAIMNDCGIWLRRKYPEIKIDLTEYSGDTAMRWGGRRPPDEIRVIGREHLVRTATFIKSPEEIRDFLAAGYGVFFCSGLKWSSVRDDWGVSKPVPGSWAHSQSVIGWDDRPETIARYGEALALILNSWAKWNSGPRGVHGTNLMIPEGAYWTPSSVLKRCSCIALSSVAGWPKRRMKSMGALGVV